MTRLKEFEPGPRFIGLFSIPFFGRPPLDLASVPAFLRNRTQTVLIFPTNTFCGIQKLGKTDKILPNFENKIHFTCVEAGSFLSFITAGYFAITFETTKLSVSESG